VGSSSPRRQRSRSRLADGSEHPECLPTGKPAAVTYARGGSYLPGSGAEGFDVQKPYVELWLRFIGFTDLRSVVVEPTLGPPDLSEQAKARALEAATALGKAF